MYAVLCAHCAACRARLVSQPVNVRFLDFLILERHRLDAGTGSMTSTTNAAARKPELK